MKFLRQFQNLNRVKKVTTQLRISSLPARYNLYLIITHLLENIKNMYSAISLSVSSSNPALRLYQRLGFEVAAQLNDSLIMKKELNVQYTCK
ncbi:GCN5-related N-acetyltransferase [Calothrix sp. NIES-4071]|nr:GCN5-related N-acetyltransferase [Calothrix sp. NIES-4071]BAZ57316.1 GCN5-related N-acetyltransferase [Calothrix sp. NIES-4105]